MFGPRRVALLVVLLTAAPAAAEPEPAGRAFFRAGPSVTVVSFRRVLTYSGFGSGLGDPVLMENAVDNTRLGGQLELAAGVQVTPALQLGGVARYAIIPSVDDARFGATSPRRLHYAVVGPQATAFAPRGLYLRGELALGRVSQEEFNAIGASAGIEVGYGRVIDGSFVQLGLVASGARTHDDEAGDHGTYDDRVRIVTISAVLSINVGRHP